MAGLSKNGSGFVETETSVDLGKLDPVNQVIKQKESIAREIKEQERSKQRSVMEDIDPRAVTKQVLKSCKYVRER